MENLITYTLVSHTPDEQGWFDRCGDYHKGTESSISVTLFLENSQAIEALAQAYVKNPQGLNELLINGVSQNEIPEEWSKSTDRFKLKYAKFLENLHEELDTPVFNRTQELQEEKKLKDKQKLEAEKLTKLRKEEEQKAKAVIAEKELLRALLAKHGNS